MRHAHHELSCDAVTFLASGQARSDNPFVTRNPRTPSWVFDPTIQPRNFRNLRRESTNKIGLLHAIWRPQTRSGLDNIGVHQNTVDEDKDRIRKKNLKQYYLPYAFNGGRPSFYPRLYSIINLTLLNSVSPPVKLILMRQISNPRSLLAYKESSHDRYLALQAVVCGNI